jgi:hypothetical protein
VLTQDPRVFLRLDVVRHAMFLAHAPYSWAEFQYLRSRDDWASTWRTALREAQIGHPTRLWFYPSTSGNLLHHAYHVARFEDAVGRRVGEFSRVVEFGWGYGSMCRLFFNLGFKGRYAIFDLPAFSRLQQYYLTSLGLDVNRELSHPAAVTCTTDCDELLAYMDRECPADAVFVATWSLSEATLEQRRVMRPVLSKCEAFLIAFQDRFGEIDNQVYFRELMSELGDVEWHCAPIEHLAGNCYLFGSRRGPV